VQLAQHSNSTATVICLAQVKFWRGKRSGLLHPTLVDRRALRSSYWSPSGCTNILQQENDVAFVCSHSSIMSWRHTIVFAINVARVYLCGMRTSLEWAVRRYLTVSLFVAGQDHVRNAGHRYLLFDLHNRFPSLRTAPEIWRIAHLAALTGHNTK